MDQNTKLNEREELILRAVVQCYITTAEPVGSRVIVKRFGLDFSPATVRNVMADLEEAGYLQQLHTSSGRVPTDRGYRYYVDYLMGVQELTLAERARIEREMSSRLNDADEVMRQTSQLLALVSHQTGMVQAPDEDNARVQHIEVMPVSPTRAAVMVADSYGRVHTAILQWDDGSGPDEFVKLSRFLNEHMRGVSCDQMVARMHGIVRMVLDENRILAERALRILQLLPANRPAPLYLEGAAQLFEQPEFRDIDRAREVFGVLEERERLAALLRANVAKAGKGASVWIGSESQEPGLREISVVASPYHVGNESAGVIGILGPRRMPYQRLTAVVDYTATMLSRFLTRLAGV
ncbi:MAG TPA: heat-inducible transcriptional repressor HrcA [Candidatus Hydrogenedentes bacterium]|nr:heat-inducible transcriptional repressor HrcA [Candidatus Hydrogenedentota bacterium]HOV72984.1 heat-inducible transcriptional repressor HrcA [Candidatus Hydrogenedentota bacterium]